MSYRSLLFGFTGRINRARCWLVVPLMLGLMLLLGLSMVVVSHAIGGAVPSFSFGTSDIFAVLDPDAWPRLWSTSALILTVRVVTTPLLLWIYLAVCAKRLHDRNRSGWWMILFFVLPGLFGRLGHHLDDSIAVGVIELALFAVSLWGFVELYLLRGTRGSNRFGADPLAIDPSAGVQRWDQHSELEFVPVSAGPSPGPHGIRGHD